MENPNVVPVKPAPASDGVPSKRQWDPDWVESQLESDRVPEMFDPQLSPMDITVLNHERFDATVRGVYAFLLASFWPVHLTKENLDHYASLAGVTTREFRRCLAELVGEHGVETVMGRGQAVFIPSLSVMIDDLGSYGLMPWHNGGDQA